MEENNYIFTVELEFDENVYDWSQTPESKDIVFPELLIGCEEMLYGNVDKVHCMNVVTHETGMMDTIEFVVRLDGVHNTLDKILSWAIEREYFEDYCVRVRELQTVLKNRKIEELMKIENSECEI